MRLNNYLIIGLLLFSMGVSAQTVSVRGKITDSKGETLPGISIVIKGTQDGTQSDIDGVYAIEAPNSESILVFSGVGFTNQEIVVSNQSIIDVVMLDDVKTLDDIVVIGYGSQEKKDVSSAITTIDSKDLMKTVNPQLVSAMQGKTSGVQIISNSGSPGAGISFNIRGVGSYSGAQPLVLVDGIILSAGGLEYINTNDVENISILKDAAATSIYGARGAHGVVLVTTKSGKGSGNNAKISYNAYYGVQQVAKKVDLLNAADYALLRNEISVNDKKDLLPEFSNPKSLGEGVDWQDQIFQMAPIQEHSLSFAKSAKNTSTYTSLTYFNQEGIVGGAKSAYDRFTSTFNTHAQFGKLKFSAKLSYAHSTRQSLPENRENESPISFALNYDPVTPLRLPNGEYAASKYVGTSIKHPVFLIEKTHSSYDNDRFVAGVNASFEVVEGLYIESKLGYDMSFGTGKGFTPIASLKTIDGNIPDIEKTLVNSASKNVSQITFWQWEDVIRYKRAFFKDHHTEFILGYMVSQSLSESIRGSGSNLKFNDPDKAYLDNILDPISVVTGGGYSTTKWRSFFGRVLYDYKGKYYFTGSFRRDESSKFGPNNRAGLFSALSLGWNVVEEDFFQVDPITFLKIRAGWGQNGSDKGVGNYQYTSLISTGYRYPVGQVTTIEDIKQGAYPKKVPNPDLRWETITQTNIGFDLTVMDKIDITVDYFVKDTDGMLASVPIPWIVGADAPTVNVASLTNKGLEMQAGYKFNVKDVHIGLSANFTIIKNEVTSLGKDGADIFTNSVEPWGSISRTSVGNPIASWYGYKTDGVFQNKGEIDNYAKVDNQGKSVLVQPDAVPGDFKFVDQNDDGKIDDKDRVELGKPIPDKTFGLTLNVDWKGVDFYLLLQGSAGNEIARAFERTDFLGANRRKEALKRWTGEGTTNKYPRATGEDLNGNQKKFSDFYLESGDFLRVKNIQMGYTFPESLVGKKYVKKIRLYASAQNLFTFTGYSGYDPEIGTKTHYQDSPLNVGVDRGFFPQARMFLGGLQVTF